MARTSPDRLTIVDAAKQSHLDGLRAMRDKLAADMDLADPAVVAQIAGRLQAVMDRIAELESAAPPEVSKVADIAARRRTTTGEVSSSGRRRNVRRA